MPYGKKKEKKEKKITILIVTLGYSIHYILQQKPKM